MTTPKSLFKHIVAQPPNRSEPEEGELCDDPAPAIPPSCPLQPRIRHPAFRRTSLGTSIVRKDGVDVSHLCQMLLPASSTQWPQLVRTFNEVTQFLTGSRSAIIITAAYLSTWVVPITGQGHSLDSCRYFQHLPYRVLTGPHPRQFYDQGLHTHIHVCPCHLQSADVQAWVPRPTRNENRLSAVVHLQRVRVGTLGSKSSSSSNSHL